MSGVQPVFPQLPAPLHPPTPPHPTPPTPSQPERTAPNPRRCEPTNVRWDHLGLGICCRRWRFLAARDPGLQTSPGNRCPFWLACLKINYMLQPFETWFAFSKMKGNHHLQGNVQVYNVRIPFWLACYQIEGDPLFRLFFCSIYQGHPSISPMEPGLRPKDRNGSDQDSAGGFWGRAKQQEMEDPT